MNELILIGGGGHCRSVLQGLKRKGVSVVGIIDSQGRVGSSILGVPVIGTDDDLKSFLTCGCKALITVGSVENNDARKKLYDKLVKMGFKLASFVSDRTIICEDVSIGNGTVVLDGAIVNVGSKFGENCIVNTGCIIEHDCIIGNHVHIAPGATISGEVQIADLSFIGAGAVLKQGIRVGRSAVIGAGSAVINDVPDNALVGGCPAGRLE